MIQKQLVGTGFRGLLNYVFWESRELGHGEARILDTNMAARTPRGLASEFGAFRALNPRVTKPVYHCALRLPEGEQLTAPQWAGFTRDYLVGMGFTDTPYLAVSHAEGHVHLIVCRVRADGSTVRDSFTHVRSNQLVHVLEERYGLSHAVNPERRREARPRLSRDERAHAARLGEEEPPKMHLARKIDAAIARCDGSRDGLSRALDTDGVTVRWNVAGTGRVSGASYELRGYTGRLHAALKGSQLGKDYAWGHLAARLEARAQELARRPAWGGERPEREGPPAAAAAQQGQERRQEEHTMAEDWRSRDVRAEGRAALRTGDLLGQAVERFAAGREHTSPADPPGAAGEVPRGGVGPPEGGARNAGPPEPKENRTMAAVFAQLVGMGCRRYEIGLRTPERGMLLRTWDAAEVLRSVPWLKAMNARGHDIYIRPEGSAGLVLVDDLAAPALDRLKLDGLEPAAVTETSQGNYQAWVRLARQPMPTDLATAAARELADRYGGDPNAADWRHFGRLAGFTNRKPEHTREDGLHPYVRIVEGSGRDAPVAHRLIERAQKRLAARSEPSVPDPLPDRESSNRPAVAGLGAVYRRQAARSRDQWPGTDTSALDWSATKQLAKAYPDATARDLRDAMREGSPRLLERKGRHVEDYLERTVTKVLQQPDVVAARQRRVPRGLDHAQPAAGADPPPAGWAPGGAGDRSRFGGRLTDAVLAVLDEQPRSVLRRLPEHDDPAAASIRAAVRRRQEREHEHERGGR